MWILYLLLLDICEVIADIFVKEWTLRSTWVLAIGALAAYLIANTFWLFSMKNGARLGRGAVLFSILSAIMALVIGIIIYKEPVTKFQTIALILGFLSIVFFSL